MVGGSPLKASPGSEHVARPAHRLWACYRLRGRPARRSAEPEGPFASDDRIDLPDLVHKANANSGCDRPTLLARGTPFRGYESSRLAVPTGDAPIPALQAFVWVNPPDGRAPGAGAASAPRSPGGALSPGSTALKAPSALPSRTCFDPRRRCSPLSGPSGSGRSPSSHPGLPTRLPEDPQFRISNKLMGSKELKDRNLRTPLAQEMALHPCPKKSSIHNQRAREALA